jgi:heme-degrading monooxygenase HmoA
VPLVSVTRLRLRSVRYLPAFALATVRAQRQARRADGHLGMALLARGARTFWTLTAWRDEAAMRAFMIGGAHGAAMAKLKHWCDEAAVAHWTQSDAGLPSWEEAHRRLQADGRRSKVLHPSPAHEAFRIDPPSPRRTADGASAAR